ncbi:uncharacterized protein BDZ99DRAFT_575633 [Mytilinidion resinicola]|uniref:Uncharacterized protein n=1 Tax=Mytilinidion resinicola TaxID=574789 RepID=A0A6A6Y6Z5_9PEZI|nr:uncharacterized protein BDZ99DRAFT_575633 [Mytilinidion resinicola]KAF2803965.1 hypothetical protein BDZ99DRAFT_575633 [Mytilinidion resinicola]
MKRRSTRLNNASETTSSGRRSVDLPMGPLSAPMKNRKAGPSAAFSLTSNMILRRYTGWRNRPAKIRTVRVARKKTVKSSPSARYRPRPWPTVELPGAEGPRTREELDRLVTPLMVSNQDRQVVDPMPVVEEDEPERLITPLIASNKDSQVLDPMPMVEEDESERPIAPVIASHQDLQVVDPIPMADEDELQP